nr:NlpC/P60 family protein [Mycolicibacterium komanii]CRL68204.1 NlpC/P60 family protein [Mycolicibacterium komanii]
MFAIATLLTLVNQVSGTPYVSGGDSPAGTDCSGLVSWVTNAATGRPVYGDRFNTGNIENALLERGFQYGTQPGALVVGWNSGHTAATLPDGTPVSSGEGGGVRVGGGGAYQGQFTKHMFLPVPPEQAMAPGAPSAPVVMMAGHEPAPPADPFAPPPPADPFAPPPPPPADPFAPPPPSVSAPPPADPFAPPPPPADPFAPPPPAPLPPA